MSSFAKAQKAARKEHRERKQPVKREKLGLLEKGKDWKKRRDDFHFKEKRINALQEKARNRNPDEFYFGMVNTATKGGVHQQVHTSNVYTADQMKLLRTQDLGYVTMKRTQERNKLDKLKANLHLLLEGSPNTLSEPSNPLQGKHTVFVDTIEEVKNFDAAAHFDTAPELVHRTFNRPRLSTLREARVADSTKITSKKILKMRAASFRELEQRSSREVQLTQVSDELQVQRNLLGKGKRSKVIIGDADKGLTIYKWKKERKR